MFRATTVLAAVVLAAGCTDYLSPSERGTIYALARVGSTSLPVFLGDNGGFPLLIADTLILVSDRPKSSTSQLSHVSVLRQTATETTRSETKHLFNIEGAQLSYDGCPVGSFCAALIAQPRVFSIVGDSLFEVSPGAQSSPYVYGRVR
jgi:hypothetical protein